jgi:hypothetical protein
MATNGTPRRKIALITGITGQVKYTYMGFWRLIFFLAKGVYILIIFCSIDTDSASGFVF